MQGNRDLYLIKVDGINTMASAQKLVNEQQPHVSKT